MKLRLLVYILATGIFFASCGKNTKSEENSNELDHLIQITHEQFKTDSMAFGTPKKMVFDDLVVCNGNIVTKPSGYAKISTPVSGIVKKVGCTSGQKVMRGQVLFELSGNELIELQNQFSETASQLKRLKSEYERINALYNDKVSTEKEFISAESEYKTAKASYSALKMKLQFIGLDASTIEEGNFYSSFSIRSPINGFVSQINLSTGEYVEQQTVMAEIIDVNQLQLKVDVFEKDINKLNPGQKIHFNLLENNKVSYTATLNSIGKTVNFDTKTILCYADIDNKKSANFVNNAYVEAQIIIKSDSVVAVSDESLIKSEETNYILSYVKDENNAYYLRKIKVELGRSTKGYVEVLNPLKSQEIITKGTYNIVID